MKTITKKIAAILIAVSILTTIPCNSALAASYTYYCNARYDYIIKYPKFFKQSKPLPENGDGITMAGKKATLLMWGAYAVVYENGKEMKKFYKKIGTKMSAVKASKKSLYYECRKKKKITFHYSYFVDGGVISMELTCRKNQKKYFAKIVKKMMKSIRQNKSFGLH